MKNTILDLSSKLIAVPSVKENPKALRSALDVARKALGNAFFVRSFENENTPSLLITNRKNYSRPYKVILNAHLDVVPARDSQFKPRIRDGKLYGRGASDMKAAAAVEILVFKELADKLDYPLALQLVTDEEVGGFNSTKHQVEKGVRADFVIAGEPTNLGINNKAKGIVWATIKTKGVSAHGAYIWNGENAVLKMQDVVRSLLNAYPVPKRETWRTTVNIARIETPNQTYNKVPDECTVSMDVRYIPEEAKTILTDLKKRVTPFSKLEVILKEPAQFTDQTNSFVVALKNSVKKVTSKKAEVIAKHGGSDIRHFNSIGCAGVTFGPAGEGLHTDEEWVDIQSLVDYYDILKDFLLSLNQ